MLAPKQWEHLFRTGEAACPTEAYCSCGVSPDGCAGCGGVSPNTWAALRTSLSGLDSSSGPNRVSTVGLASGAALGPSSGNNVAALGRDGVDTALPTIAARVSASAALASL